MTAGSGGYALGRDEGDAIWFLGARMTVKAGDRQTRGVLTVIDCECPAGFTAPPHVHHLEDEAFYLLLGDLLVTCDDRSWEVAPGGFVLLPKGRPHHFAVVGDQPARLVQITAPAQFEHFAAEVGTEATGPGLPEPAAPDIPLLIAAAARHHIDILPSDA